MAIDFPDSPTDGQIFSANGRSWQYNATKGIWQSVVSSGGGSVDLSSVSQSIIPSANVTYDLGTANSAWRDLYLSGNSIFLGAGEITSTAEGTITLPEGSSVGGISIGAGGATVYANTSLLPTTGLTAGQFAFAGNTLFMTNGSGWYKIALVNQAPSITISTDNILLGATGNTINITYTTQDPEGVPVSVSLSNSGFDSTQANVTLYTANNTVTVENLSANDYNGTITLTVTDGISQGFDIVALTVGFVSDLWDETVLSIGTSSNNGLNNSTFIDRSTNAHTVTTSGTPIQTAFHPYLNNWSVDFQNDGVLTIDDSVFQFSGDFTINCFVYIKDFASRNAICCLGDTSTSANSFQILIETNQKIYFTTGTGTDEISTNALEVNRWYYLSFVRESTTLSIYIDAVLDSTHTLSQSFSETGAFIGRNRGGAQKFSGHISNFQSIDGTAVAPTSIPTEQLTSTANTTLLTCQSNRFIDNSTNAHAITVNGNPAISAFNPFGQGSEYAVGENKGSVSIGSGDYLTTAPSVPATDDFTLECWIYPTDISAGYQSTQGIYGQYQNGGSNLLLFYMIGGVLRAFSESSVIVASTTFKNNEWYHIAMVRSSGSDTIYINGTNEGTGYIGSISQVYDAMIGFLVVESRDYHFRGTISDLKVTDSAVYTANFTPPSSPVGNTNASLYLPMDNAGIFDKTGNHTLTLNENIVTSTTQTKFADTSLSLGGGGDGVNIGDNTTFKFLHDKTVDYTIEGWIYSFGTSGRRSIIMTGAASASSGVLMEINAGLLEYTIYRGVSGSITSINAGSINTNTWYHIALSVDSNTIRFFLDGNLVNTVTWSLAGSTAVTQSAFLSLGRDSLSTVVIDFSGYIENLQILKGVAKYTTNFTPPSRTQGRVYQAES